MPISYATVMVLLEGAETQFAHLYNGVTAVTTFQSVVQSWAQENG